jgi:hypothetical protein
MPGENTYRGQCQCGAVQFTVTGKPAGMGYRHCDSCRSWSAKPANAFTLWSASAVKIIRGTDFIEIHDPSSQRRRSWCVTCGGHVFTEHTSLGLIGVHAAELPGFSQGTSAHLNYQETMLRAKQSNRLRQIGAT